MYHYWSSYVLYIFYRYSPSWHCGRLPRSPQQLMKNVVNNTLYQYLSDSILYLCGEPSNYNSWSTNRTSQVSARCSTFLRFIYSLSPYFDEAVPANFTVQSIYRTTSAPSSICSFSKDPRNAWHPSNIQSHQPPTALVAMSGSFEKSVKGVQKSRYCKTVYLEKDSDWRLSS